MGTDEDLVPWSDDAEFEEWIKALIPVLLAAAPMPVSGLFVGMLRGSISDPRHPQSLRPAELQAVREDESLVIAAAQDAAATNAPVRYEAVPEYVRARIRFGDAATGRNPILVNLQPIGTGKPIGPEAAARLEEFTASFKRWCGENGHFCEVKLASSDPGISWIGPCGLGDLRYRDVHDLAETGAGAERIVEALAACSLDARAALHVLRDGVAPPLADGAL